ncbi:hypothetical protein ACFYRC_09845 [Streptomyces sp. NPDC005279]|uniref:hypothetical protein n=1 Tax=Streptomyces sp. NPDC005279 TaxID=3364712 RepID=UPI00367B3B3E
MARDLVLIADGGGLTAAAPVPVQGAELVARTLARPGRVVPTVWLDGAPAGRIKIAGRLAAVSLAVESRSKNEPDLRKQKAADESGCTPGRAIAAL